MKSPLSLVQLCLNICAWFFTRFFSQAFFWGFNASLLLVAYLGLLPFIGLTLIGDLINGLVPWDFFLPFVGLVGVPTACATVGLLPKQKRRLSLPQLFWGVEAPLLALCTIRFFWLRDLTPGTTLFLAAGLIGIVSLTHWLYQQHSAQMQPELEPPLASTSGHLIGFTLMLMLAVYGTALISFYLLPTLFWSIHALIFSLPQVFIALFYASILLPILVILTGLLLSPVGALWVYGRAWWQTVRLLAGRQIWAGLLTTGVVAGGLGLFLMLNQPPQITAFNLLAAPAVTPQAQQELLQKQDVIRQGLVNAYLARYRYPRATSLTVDGHISQIYRSLQVPDSLATAMQQAYNLLLTPFTYQGDANLDAEKASALYGQFFDTPILRGEKPAIQNALESTFNRSEAKAGLNDVNEERVWLAEQQLKLTPQGDWAEVELHEVYENKTFDQQEILYFFSLPETAVMTGLWLGETADLSQRYAFSVSPRGAAQQVYNAEVTRRQDPALLEQVGPRQYRLRAFPIPPVGQGQMHLWLSYKVLQQPDGWALPALHERRNIFWTNRTQRQLNGKSVNSDTWLPAAPTAKQSQPVAHQMPLAWGDGSTAQIIAQPFAASDYKLPQGKRFAILLDGSYSMNAHASEAQKSLQWLQSQVLVQNQADLYLTAAAPVQPRRLDDLKALDPKPTFYGTLAPSDMLQQFLTLRGDTAYDAVLLLTDSGSYELTADLPAALKMPAPLWMVHLGELQPAYDDATLAAIQNSGGGVSTELQPVMQRLGTQPSLGAGTTRLNLVDGYAWYLAQKPLAGAKTDSSFELLAARQWVTHLSQYVKPDQLQELDTIHAITKQYGIVSPYSSMLVLVNDAQRQALKQAEQDEDRFKREVEDQALPQPSAPLAVSATPEPSDWLLLLLASLLLFWVYRVQKQNLTSQSE